MSLVYSKEYLEHKSFNHPESPERLKVMMNSLEQGDVMSEISLVKPRMADETELLRVHSPEHVQKIKTFCEQGGGYLDMDTYTSPESYNIAKLAAGGVITAGELVLNSFNSAYAIVRPPGHHATAERAMGFCLFNNLAIGLEHMREEHHLEKFLIFDFDAHYGNGTAEIFYNDPHVMYISIHQDPHTIFPGQGFVQEIGGEDALGSNINLPMAPGSQTPDYLYILEKVLEPVFKDFGADFYFFDVGFDALRSDPLSSLMLDDHFFEWIASEMIRLTDHRVLVLEGGYNLESMARANLKMINVLKDEETKNEYILGYENLEVKNETKTFFQEVKDNLSPFFTF
jgi:acetoin utilization deacetylase AcuC-like enzyme